MRSEPASHFSDDYAEARARFREVAVQAGARIEQLSLDTLAPDSGPLTIDIARIGADQPERVIVHSSGLHGVEGFAGSAIQLALLADAPRVPSDGALILVHALNPYGMAWLRRCNEHNVDLNRNFDDALPREGVPPAYRLLNGLLNPPTPPRRDLFFARAAVRVARHGLTPLKQAIAGGQYEFPQGLFFGGQHLESGPALYQAWLARTLATVTHLYAVDVHTGLGPFAHDTLVAHGAGEDVAAVETTLGRAIEREFATEGVTYAIRGGYARAFDVLPDTTQVCVITQEFGTYSPLRVLHALREENRAHLHAGAQPSHPAKQHLKSMFAPDSPRWRAAVVHRGLDLARATVKATFKNSLPV